MRRFFQPGTTSRSPFRKARNVNHLICQLHGRCLLHVLCCLPSCRSEKVGRSRSRADRQDTNGRADTFTGQGLRKREEEALVAPYTAKYGVG